MTGADLVQEARTWRGTAFMHGASICGIGCDCVGLLLGGLRNLGELDWSPPGYSPLIDPAELERYLLQFCDRVEEGVLQAGDILLFTFAGQAIHIGLYSGEGTLIHSWERAGRVVEHPFDSFWEGHRVGSFRWRGLDG